MGTSVVGALNAQRLTQLQAGAKSISAMGGSNGTGSVSFRFAAGFDGTYNDKDNLPEGAYQTNVANIIDQIQIESTENSTIRGEYYQGVGAGGSNGGVFNAAVAPTNAIHYAAEIALADFSKQAQDYLIANRGATFADLSASVVGFSRGCATAVVFAQLLNERGLVTPDGTVIAPPGAIQIHGMALLEPVHTFVSGEMSIPDNVVGQVVVVRAGDEYRTDFPAAGYGEDSRVTTVVMPGNHAGIGGGYDLNGTGAAVLEGITSYFQNSGTAVAPIPDNLRFDPDQPVALYTEAYQTARNGDVMHDENGAPMMSWRLDDTNGSRRLIPVHYAEDSESANTPPTGYCYATPDGDIYELAADGTLRREIAGPEPMTEIRDATGAACVYDGQGQALTTLGADERLATDRNGSPCVVQPNGDSQRLADAMLDDSRAMPPGIAPGNLVDPQELPDTHAGNSGNPQHAGPPPAPAPSPFPSPSTQAEVQGLPTFTDYLTATHLTPAQEIALAAQLDRQHPGGSSNIGFVALPGGSVMLQNTDGDIVGQLDVETDGTVRWSGIGGERSYIRPDGMVQDQHMADRTAAATDERNATQTATAVGLLNAIVGLQNWESMNDLQRAAAALAVYNIVDNLNGGQLPGQLGSVASALGLFSALERGDVGGAVYSGLNLVESLTSNGPGTGLVSQTVGRNFLPALGMVLAIRSGDPAAMLSSGLSLMSSLGMIGPWGATAAVVITLLSTILADTDIPTREGRAHAQWGPDGQLQVVTDLDTEGGGASAAGWMRGMAEGLQARLAGSGSSLVPGLLPSIGYSLDPDGVGPAHGAPGFVYLEWIDSQGRSQTRYYDSDGNRNDGSGETLAGDFLQHAATAIAPDWVVATALAHWQQDTAQRPQLPCAAMPDIDTDGLHQTLHALVLGDLAEARAAQLDTDADGFVERSQWLGVKQAALALDADGNGAIDAGELVDTRGGGRTDLDWLDANRDGILDSRDPAFAALRLWVDTNADGRSDPDATAPKSGEAVETRTLAEAGIVAIDFRTDPPTAVRADGSREIFGAQSYVGDVLGNRYDRVVGGVLQGMEQADGSALFQLLAANTHAFDGQADHMHAGENLGGGASTVEAGDRRLTSTGANTTAGSHRRTDTTLATGDARMAGGSAGTTRSGQSAGSQPANGTPASIVRDSGERGIAVLFADAATGTGAAMRNATAAMVRSAESGTLAGGGGAGLLGVLAAGMAAWPALADAGVSDAAGIDRTGIAAVTGVSALPHLATPALSGTGPADAIFALPRPEYGIFSHIDRADRSGAGAAGTAGTAARPGRAANPDALEPADGGTADLHLRPDADPPARPFPPPAAGVARHGIGDDGSPQQHAAAGSRLTPTASPTVQYVRPDVTGETATSAEDDGLCWSAASLLANDRCRNTLGSGSTGLHIDSVFAPRHGSVSLQPDASGALQVVFVPDADYHGEAGFSYTVADAFGLESRAEMSLTITPVNDAPVTHGETASADEDQALYFRAADLLANDRDADSDVGSRALRRSRSHLSWTGRCAPAAGACNSASPCGARPTASPTNRPACRNNWPTNSYGRPGRNACCGWPRPISMPCSPRNRCGWPKGSFWRCRHSWRWPVATTRWASPR